MSAKSSKLRSPFPINADILRIPILLEGQRTSPSIYLSPGLLREQTLAHFRFFILPDFHGPSSDESEKGT